MSLDEFKDKLSISIFGMTKANAHQKGICVNCKEAVDVSVLKKADANEYKTTGLCPKCFNDITAGLVD